MADYKCLVCEQPYRFFHRLSDCHTNLKVQLEEVKEQRDSHRRVITALRAKLARARKDAFEECKAIVEVHLQYQLIKHVQIHRDDRSNIETREDAAYNYRCILQAIETASKEVN
jgi:hypothetical protein